MKSDFVDKEVFKYNPNLGSPEPYNNEMGIAPYHSNLSSPYPYCLNQEDTDINKNESILTEDISKSDEKVLQPDTTIDIKSSKILNTSDKEVPVTVEKNIDDYDILSVNTKNSFDIKSNIAKKYINMLFIGVVILSVINLLDFLPVIKMKSLVL